MYCGNSMFSSYSTQVRKFLKAGHSHLSSAGSPATSPAPGGTSRERPFSPVYCLPLGKEAISRAAGISRKVIICSQASEHFVAIINTCDPQVLTLSWKHQTTSPRHWDHNSITWFVCITFVFSQTSKLWTVQPSVSPPPPLFFSSFVCQFAQNFPLALLVPWRHQDECFRLC